MKRIKKYRIIEDNDPVPPGSGFGGHAKEIEFTVRTYPPTYKTRVYILFTRNKWKSWQQMECKYSYTEKGHDYWYYKWYTYADYNGELSELAESEELVINYCFKVIFPNNQIYWDNNLSKNYEKKTKIHYPISEYEFCLE